MTITHTFVNPKADGADATVARPSDWNADHVVTTLTLNNNAFTKSVTLYADANPLVGVDALYFWNRPLTGGANVSTGLPKTLVMAANATWCDTNVLDGTWYTSCWMALQNQTTTIKFAPTAGIGWCSSADFSSATDDLFLRRDAANTLAQRNGTAAQTFRIYGTYTDASNYERGVIDWSTTSNILTVGAQAAGTGTGRSVYIAAADTFKTVYFNSAVSARDRVSISTDSNDPLIQNDQVNGLWFRIKAKAGLSLESADSLIYLWPAIGASAMVQVDGGTTPNGSSQITDNTGTTRRTGIGLVNYFGPVAVCAPGRPGIDEAKQDFYLTGTPAAAAATTNLTGGHIRMTPGNGASGSAGAATGGSLFLDGGQGYGTGTHGNVVVGGSRGNLVASQLLMQKRIEDVLVTLTDGATVALDSALGNVFHLTAAGDRTISVPTNKPASGRTQRIIIRHEASGADRTLALTTGSAGAFRFGTTITGLTATTNGLADYIGCVFNQADDRWDVISYSKGL